MLLGATSLGCEIIGSYEDTGFGLPVQQANFPHLDFRALRKDWPAQDLSEVFGIAHPPCSAFSVMTNSKAAKGVDSKAFACTKSVLQYFVDNKALGFAVESVVPAMQGGWPIHQHYADEYGYHLYRILQNGSMFGAQYRDRFWSVYIKKGAVPQENMAWILRPQFKTVRQVVGEFEGASPAGLDAELAKLQQRFVEQAGCTPDDMAAIFRPEPEEMCSVDDRLWKRKFPEKVRWDVCKEYVTKFASGAMVMLNPNGTCPVLLGGSWWWMDGRNLSETAYKQLMGFPVDYIFPEGTRRADNYRADFRTYLSKGVMPPVAKWILGNVARHLGATVNPVPTAHVDVEPYVIECRPDHVADFRISRKSWGQARPPLRADDHLRRAQLTQPYVPGEEPPVAEPRAPRQPRAPKEPRQPRTPQPRGIARPRSKSAWNAPELETALAETLFVRPHTADTYALHESHGYHRMGVRAGDVVLDLGAHIGCVASRAALVGAAKVISVEAEPDNFALLEQNTRTFPNVVTVYGAVYGGDGATVSLHRTKRRNDEGHSTGTHSVLFKTQGDVVDVPRLDLRQLIAEHQPTVIKCDIEGSEFSLDWTDLPPCVRSVGIELHTRRDQHRPAAQALIDTLTAQGFTPVHHLNMASNFSAIIAFMTRPDPAVSGSASVAVTTPGDSGAAAAVDGPATAANPVV